MLRFLDKWNNHRKNIAKWYLEILPKKNPEWVLPVIPEEIDSCWHLFVIRTKNREMVQKDLEKKGIKTQIHYPIPPHLQTCFKSLNYSKGDFPVTELLCDTSLSLPIWPGSKDDDINYITSTIKTFFNQL